ncbi:MULTISPECIES: MerR family transcriptional regulator [Streptomyces]|uniref:MerR family transcriptional regulator n=2 Tax=Streptomyces TaxID=1883 RepID=A0ABU2RRS6_9ACTN|nr:MULTISPECIES: MerR family transcriptional regulator [unclassified Streptomyces]MBK3594047.1 MerR family transcriptional regulator [Streptomyces sp. MBT51]MDT0430609.1 MerR family transcriptional regulator [Streptomyces sp. DSM 41770]
MSTPGPSGRRSGPRTVPTELAALAAGVSPATIRKWASRGKLTRHGTPRRAEYDLDELRTLAAGASRAPRPEQPPGPAQR